MVHAGRVFVASIQPSRTMYECQDLLSICDRMHVSTDQTLVYTLILFLFFFFAFPSYISGVHHFWVRFLRMWPFFNPTFKVVTFLLRGWCVLGVFLLPAFTRLGHERQDLWVRAMKCMCAQTRPRFILSSERVFGGMEFEPMLTTGKCPQSRIEPATLWTVSPSTTNWAIPAHILSFERAWGGKGGGGGGEEGMELELMLTPWEKSPLPVKFSSEEGWAHNTKSNRTVCPTHYQWAPTILLVQNKFITSFDKPTGCANMPNFIQMDCHICEKMDTFDTSLQIPWMKVRVIQTDIKTYSK